MTNDRPTTGWLTIGLSILDGGLAVLSCVCGRPFVEEQQEIDLL